MTMASACPERAFTRYDVVDEEDARARGNEVRRIACDEGAHDRRARRSAGARAAGTDATGPSLGKGGEDTVS